MARFLTRLAFATLASIAITLALMIVGAPVNSAAFYLGIALAVGGLYAHDWLEVREARRIARARLGL